MASDTPFVSMSEKVQRFLDDPGYLNFVMGKSDARKLLAEVREAERERIRERLERVRQECGTRFALAMLDEFTDVLLGDSGD